MIIIIIYNLFCFQHQRDRIVHRRGKSEFKKKKKKNWDQRWRNIKTQRGKCTVQCSRNRWRSLVLAEPSPFIRSFALHHIGRPVVYKGTCAHCRALWFTRAWPLPWCDYDSTQRSRPHHNEWTHKEIHIFVSVLVSFLSRLNFDICSVVNRMRFLAQLGAGNDLLEVIRLLNSGESVRMEFPQWPTIEAENLIRQ